MKSKLLGFILLTVLLQVQSASANDGETIDYTPPATESCSGDECGTVESTDESITIEDDEEVGTVPIGE